MPRFDYCCPNKNCENVTEFTLSRDGKHVIACLRCGQQMQRYFSAENLFMFQEDRCRFAKNSNTGTDFSEMLGQNYPQTREERNRIYKEKGIDPISKRDMPQEWKVAAEYAEHIATGGDRADHQVTAQPNYNDPSIKSVSQMMKESGFRKGF